MKQFFLSLIVISLFCFASEIMAQEVQTGKFHTSNAVEGYTLDKNDGVRTMLVEVEYPKPFNKKPEVMVGVNLIDASNAQNLRYSVEVKSVSRDGFTLLVKTWANTRIFEIGGGWIAVAPQ